jgi:hypothetical protein
MIILGSLTSSDTEAAATTSTSAVLAWLAMMRSSAREILVMGVEIQIHG